MPEKANHDQLILVGIGVLAAYWLYKKASGVVSGAASAVEAGVSHAYGGAVNSVADVLTSMFGPPQPGMTVDYIVMFPDGASHAVPSTNVDSNGNFIMDGTTYQLLVGSDGKKYATLAL